jgi:DNA repair protein RecO (recombination protein O)
MPLIKTEGIVLSTRPFSESSKILTLYTKSAGRLSILVKGGRKGTKKFPGGLETLNQVEVQYYYKAGRELQAFKNADLLNAFLNVRNDLGRTYTALSLAETVLRTTLDDDTNENLFNSLLAILSCLNEQSQKPWTIRWKGLLEICRNLGFGIQLEGCQTCGGKSGLVGFNLASGGFICEKELLNQPGVITSTGEIWAILRFLDKCPLDATGRAMISPATGRRIERLFLEFFRYHVPNLRSFETWKKLPELYWGEEKES